MPGILDPQTQGLLQAAFAAMQASGPQRMPVSAGSVIGQAGTAGLQGYDAAQKAQLAELQARKLKMDLDLQESLTNGAGILGGLNDPDKMEAVGTRLALAGHPGGAALVNAAEKVRAKRAADASFATMKSQPALAPDPQEVAQAADDTSGQQTPAPAERAAKGGLFSTLLSSPFVGKEAGLLQSQLNDSKDANPESWLKHYERLATAHRSAQEKATEREFREAQKNTEPLVAVIKNGKPVMLPRSEAIGLAPANAGAVAQVVPDAHKDLHGDDYIATLPPGMQNVVKSIVAGKTSLNDASMRYGNREAMKERVLQADPTWMGNRFKNRQEFENPNGKTQLNVTAMQTAISHMGTTSELVDALQNKDLRAANAVVNRLRTELGKPEINNAEIAIQAVGNEMMRVFRQVGASEKETQEWIEKFNAAKNSPAQLRGALQTGATLLKGRMDAVNDLWKRTVDPTSDYQGLFSEKNNAALAKIGIVGKGIPLTDQPASTQKPARRWNPATGRIEG